VQERVRRGGHFISEEDIRRRFERSIRNLPKLIQLSDFTSIIDNTFSPIQLLVFEANRLVFEHQTLPKWVSENLRDFFIEN
jgi:predicted ABC-type ATPase